MPTLAIPLKDILTDAAERVDFAALPEAEAIARIKGIYGFLASEVEVAIRDGVAVITLPDAKANKASQALDKIEQATRAARSGNYRQAIRYYEEALKVLPDHTDARRDLAMCLFEMGNYDAAKQHLIRVLQLAPTDAGAYLVLGNLYYQAEQDYGSAERFYAAALDLEPDNPYVLNSYARLLGKRGRTEEALTLFEQAIERAPRLPTARLGLALALDQMDDDAGALAALEALFAQPVSDDPRHAGVYEEARRAYADLRRRRAAASTDETQQRLRRVLDRYRSETGIEVRLELDPTLLTDAKIELAWRTGRPYHAIKFAGGGASAYTIAHEFEHLRMETAARAAGVNRLFTTAPAQSALAERSLEKELRKLRSRRGVDPNRLERYISSLVPNLLTQLYNLPLDCFVNRRVYAAYPWLQDALFTSMAAEQAASRQMITHSDIQAMTPARIYQSSLALNAAYALFVDALFGGVTAYAAAYQPTGMLATGQRLYDLYRQAGDAPGAELALVDAWAEELRLREWYTWRPDRSEVVASTVAAGHRPPQHGQAVREGGVTNPAFFAEPNADAATLHYLLAALKRFGRMELAAVWAVASEIAVLGQSGIDYGKGEQYTLRSVPGETFSGMELLCLQYVGFKLTHPELDLHLPFDAAYQRALHLHEFGR